MLLQQQAAKLVAGVVEADEEGNENVPAPGVAADAPMVMDPGLLLNMFNVKPPQLADLEIVSMKKFILDYKRFAQKCPPQMLRSIHHFILEEYLDFVIIENSIERPEKN
jgi:hypothetical protein